jgi:hypothetical protein
MGRARLIFLLMWNVIFMYKTSLVAGQTDQCNVNADCSTTNTVCCGGIFQSRRKSCVFFSCIGRHCLTDGDCGGKGECCKFNKCVINGCPECSSHSNCVTSEYCCKHRRVSDHNVCRRSCVGETCFSSSDCAVGECCRFNKCAKQGCIVVSQCSSNLDCPVSQYCCKRQLLNSVCRQSCVGEACLLNSDCGLGEHCSSNFLCSTSTTDPTSLAGWVIGIIVTGK